MFDNRDNIDFGNTNIPKLFRSVFIPTLLGMLFNMAFIITDGIFVGHGIGAYGLATINLIAPIMMLINGIGMMFGIGVSVVAAIHLGKENVKAARINVTQSFIAATCVGIILAIILYAFPNIVLRIVGTSDQLYFSTREYYLWFLPTCLLLLIQTLGMFVIRLDGSPTFAMISNIVPALGNIFFDYLFIFPCKLGLKGAALATDLGQVMGVLLILFYMLFRTRKLKLYRLKSTLTSLRLSLRNVSYMTQVGLSGLIGELAMAAIMMTGNILFGKYLGDNGIAAYSIACYLLPLIFMTYSAIAQSAQPIISFNFGAEKSQRVKQTFRYSLVIAIIIGTIVTLAFAFLPNPIVKIFINEGSSPFSIATNGLPYFSIGIIFMGINLCTIGYLQSINQSKSATILTLLRGFCFTIASFILLPRFMGTVGLWLAVPLAEILTAITIIFWSFAASKNPRLQ